MKLLSRLVSWLVSIIVLVVGMVFAVNNRQEITIDCWPMDYDITMPLFVMTLGSLLAGLIMGATLPWLAGLRLRWDKRSLSKEVEQLKNKLNEETNKPV